MECPNCHRRGNALKRIFSKRGNTGTRFCVYCNTEVRIIYNWKKIFVLSLVVLVLLLVLNVLLQMLGWPGITSGFAGGMGGAVIAIMIRREPYVKIELVNPPKTRKKRRN